MQPIDYWKLCSQYSIVQAALLTCGHIPDDYQYNVEGQTNTPAGYVAVRSALYNAVKSGRLKATERPNLDEDGNPYGIDVHETVIDVGDLAQFFRSSGHEAPFFDRPSNSQAGLPGGPPYPPKLAAANKAWAAVTADPRLLAGKSPKQALEKWLSENAADLQLLNRDGTVNRTGIEEICKVANWKPSGGATPTPSLTEPLQSAPLVRLPAPRNELPFSTAREIYDLDDDIPF
ncbi:hypothetical protein [Brevundimonas sp.]|uniref:hypothetical protein n=1 Tax=Brevundimonas sp. TaxID=1871086 RepID=UPI002ED93DEB